MDELDTNNISLTRRDCDKYISLIDFIKECKDNIFDSFYIIIPLNILGSSGFTILDIKKLSEILKKPLLVNPKHVSIENPNNDVILRHIAFNMEKEKIMTLKMQAIDDSIPQKEIIREKETIIKTEIKNIIKYVNKRKPVKLFLQGNEFSCEENKRKCVMEGKRLEYVKKIINSRVPLKKADLNPKPVKNFSKEIKKISRRIEGELNLKPNKFIIINPHKRGYIISDEYEIQITHNS